MGEDPAVMFAVGAGMILLGAAGLFLPARFNPFRLKRRYENLAPSRVAEAMPRYIGLGFVLLGVVLLASGFVMRAP